MTEDEFVRRHAGRTMNESGHQQCFIRWCEMQKGIHPELEWVFATPNGGYRNKATAGRMKGEGVKPGVFDLALDVARKGYHGLKIEMKVPRVDGIKGVRKTVYAGKLSEDQKRWLAHYQANGYAAYTAFGWEDAVRIVKEYLSE